MALGRPRVGKERKQLVTGRVDPDVLAAVKDVSDNMSRTLEEALKLWLVTHAPKATRKARRKVPA
jgi:hypothetical protein